MTQMNYFAILIVITQILACNVSTKVEKEINVEEKLEVELKAFDRKSIEIPYIKNANLENGFIKTEQEGLDYPLYSSCF